MNKKFVTESERIKQIKQNILACAPSAEKVDIMIDRYPTKEFRTKILVTLPRQKPIIAKKIASTYHSSLDKCAQAIYRQIGKLSKPKSKSRSYRLEPLAFGEYA